MSAKTLYLSRRLEQPSRLWYVLAGSLFAILLFLTGWLKPDSFRDWYYLALGLCVVIMVYVATYTRRAYGPPRFVLEGDRLTVRREGYGPPRVFSCDEIAALRIAATEVEVVPKPPQRRTTKVPVRSYAIYQQLQAELLTFADRHGIAVRRS